ncbi:hypothetical protein BC629DRAFT_1651925 [Irpex lacteus]|nr:hypothetical protein BC629DRAFT_1651925 [Irpex lacteus]
MHRTSGGASDVYLIRRKLALARKTTPFWSRFRNDGCCVRGQRGGVRHRATSRVPGYERTCQNLVQTAPERGGCARRSEVGPIRAKSAIVAEEGTYRTRNGPLMRRHQQRLRAPISGGAPVSVLVVLDNEDNTLDRRIWILTPDLVWPHK